MPWLAWLACGGPDETFPPVDLSVPVPPGQARAGVLLDGKATFGGISAEARPGDVMLVNDRVRFVVQGVRPGGWYVPEGGGVIDADVVRPEGVVGRDAVDDWSVMFGLGRMCVPETVEVVADGRDGGPAIVRVTGYEGPMGLVEGATETPGLVPRFGLTMETEYELAPDSWLLEVRSVAHTTDLPATLSIGDVLLGADEVLDPFSPGRGLGPDDSLPRPWVGYVSEREDVAYVIGADGDEQLVVAGYTLLTALASMLVGFTDLIDVPPEQTLERTRWWGVGPDLATLTAALAEVRGEPLQDVSGEVRADDGPVAGARVVIDVDGAPWTAATTHEDGTFSARVPPGVVSFFADGRGHGRVDDLPTGAAPISPYARGDAAGAALAALRDGATEIPVALGRGSASGASPLTLGVPATLEIHADDGLPFAVRVSPTVEDPPRDERRQSARPDGLLAAGWSRDGEVALPVEPGHHQVLVHRGPRYEASLQEVDLVAGQVTRLDVHLDEAFEHPGWLLGDPHEHASPSPDGAITMEDRLIVAAAQGLQLHFGTDHDHLADYRPLIEPLGLGEVLRTVVSDEVSPPMRGHFNIYPVVPDPSRPNNGAWTWWTEMPASTDAMVDTLRERHGPDFVLQSNHPTDLGMASSAGWTAGQIDRGDYWTDRIGAMEVMNDGAIADYLDVWVDLVTRGAEVTPVAVSDSHGYFEHSFGFSATWLQVGVDSVADATDDEVAAALREGRVIPTNGPFLEVDPAPGATVAPGATLSLRALGASWVTVDRFRVFEDGEEVAVLEGEAATWTVDVDHDALIHVIAEGDTPMSPVWDHTPWALAGPWRVDVGADGWDPPLPPLVIAP